MATPVDTIAKSFMKLKESLSESDAYDFASTELKDVRKAMRDIDNEQRQRQSAQNLQRIEPFIRGLEKYAKIIEVLCQGTPYLSFVWAPIKLMLQLASQHRDIFEALLTAYVDIGSALPRFDRYQRAFGEDPVFQNVLASIYCGILDFHQQAYIFFKKRAWNVLFRSLWTDFGARFKGIIDDLKKQRDFLDREASSIDMLESKESRIRSQQEIEQRQKYSLLLIEQNESILKKLQFDQSISWLAISDQDQDSRFERLCRRRHDETCVWITKQAHIMSWLENDAKNPIIWLCGKPGAGKSVMCSYLVSTLSTMPDVDVLYFFCANQDAEDSCSSILRTIILQLLRRHPELASLLSNEFISTGSACIMSQLRILVPKILETVPCPRIVIDGIDETSKETQKAILKELQTVCLGAKSNCKIIFSSRKEVLLAERLAKKPQILLDGRAEVNSDIRLYIKHKILKLETQNTDLLQSIGSILVEKANGMFLWVHLVVEELRGCYSDFDLEESAKSLPKGLEAAYGRILTRISKERGAPHAIRILQWMACSYRPLKVYELLDGISFRASSSSFNLRPKMQRDVLNLCRPLIEDDDLSQDTIGFVHFSAKEFILKGDSQDGKPFIKSDDAHFNIAFSCVAYLGTAVCLLPSRSNEHQRAAFIATGLHGLLPYANQFWIHHLLVYCASLDVNQIPVHAALLTQLNALLQLQKSQASSVASGPYEPNDHDLTALHRLPGVQSMISDILRFRNAMKTVETSGDFERTAEEISLQACDGDPSHLGMLRIRYQSTLESLLDQHAAKTFPGIQQETILNFQAIFGIGAFTCRYLHCPRATDGFNTHQQRDTHEAAHRRQFRCKYPTCVNFSTGFTTKGSLNRHNKQYHQVVEETRSLSDIISKLRIRSPSVVADAPMKMKPVRMRTGAPPRIPSVETPDQLATGPIMLDLSLTVNDWNRLAEHDKPQVRLAIKRSFEATIEHSHHLNHPLFSWQTEFSVFERLQNLYNITIQFAATSMNVISPSLERVTDMCRRFEERIFSESLSREAYTEEIAKKMNQMKERATRQAERVQPTQHESMEDFFSMHTTIYASAKATAGELSSLTTAINELTQEKIDVKMGNKVPQSTTQEGSNQQIVDGTQAQESFQYQVDPHPVSNDPSSPSPTSSDPISHLSAPRRASSTKCLCGFEVKGIAKNRTGNLKRHMRGCKVVREQYHPESSPPNIFLCEYPNCDKEFMRHDSLASHQIRMSHLVSNPMQISPSERSKLSVPVSPSGINFDVEDDTIESLNKETNDDDIKQQCYKGVRYLYRKDPHSWKANLSDQERGEIIFTVFQCLYIASRTLAIRLLTQHNIDLATSFELSVLDTSIDKQSYRREIARISEDLELHPQKTLRKMQRAHGGNMTIPPAVLKAQPSQQTPESFPTKAYQNPYYLAQSSPSEPPSQNTAQRSKDDTNVQAFEGEESRSLPLLANLDSYATPGSDTVEPFQLPQMSEAGPKDHGGDVNGQHIATSNYR